MNQPDPLMDFDRTQWHTDGELRYHGNYQRVSQDLLWDVFLPDDAFEDDEPPQMRTRRIEQMRATGVRSETDKGLP